MKNAIAIFCAACLARAALAVTMASQPWTTNRIAEAEARVAVKITAATNAIPAPDFSQNNAQLRETIVAVSPPADFTDATNHTRAALSAFAGTGTVARATTYGTPTRWTDATGCVWEVTNANSDWYVTTNGIPFKTLARNGIDWVDDDTSLSYQDVSWYFTGPWIDGAYTGSEDIPSFTVETFIESYGSFVNAEVGFKRDYQTNLVGRVALMNDIPDVSGYATQQQATNAAVAVADAKISTNNAAFVEAVTNCPVVIASGGGGGDGFPAGDWSDYGTLGALLAAIIAAITWLKNNQRYALHTVTLTNGAGTLLDRAGNRVVVSGDTTLTLPALVNAGKARDFLVRLEISGSTVPTITFAAPTGETITYETDGDEFPVPDDAGDWLYSFTESCVAYKFAVSLKKVNEVAQGGA